MIPKILALTILAGTVVLATTACTRIPRGVTPVTGFDADRYLGKWHEIARFDHRFERGMTHVTAEYSRRDDGTIAVRNQGFDVAKGDWRDATAVARFQGDPTVASLTVTFRWPFSGGYHVIALDQDDYQWALVSGPSRGYLWILARERTLDPETYDKLVAKARELGYDVDGFIVVDQSLPLPEGRGG
jgi:apolipoprotein D and lipocalin family protein